MSRRLLIAGLTLAMAACQPRPDVFDGRWARYEFSEGSPIPGITHLVLAVPGRETAADETAFWWRLEAFSGDRRRFSIDLLAGGLDFLHVGAPSVPVHRYLLTDDEGALFEYIDAASSRALLPKLGFFTHLTPRASSVDDPGLPLFERGSWLGKPVHRAAGGTGGLAGRCRRRPPPRPRPAGPRRHEPLLPGRWLRPFVRALAGMEPRRSRLRVRRPRRGRLRGHDRGRLQPLPGPRRAPEVGAGRARLVPGARRLRGPSRPAVPAQLLRRRHVHGRARHPRHGLRRHVPPLPGSGESRRGRGGAHPGALPRRRRLRTRSPAAPARQGRLGPGRHGDAPARLPGMGDGGQRLLVRDGGRRGGLVHGRTLPAGVVSRG